MKGFKTAALALVAVFAATPALAQSSQDFRGSICEIDPAPFNVDYKTPEGFPTVFTYSSRKLCSGVASKRNIKLECTAPLPGWTFGNRTAKNFVCTINGDQCGLSPKPQDKSAPYLTATQQTLTVLGGVAQLTCFYKP